MTQPRETGSRGEEHQIDNPLSGLDMRPTLLWYQDHQDELIERLSRITGDTSPYPIENSDYFHIDEARIAGVIGLFSDNALARSRLQTGSIIGKPTLYFSRETKSPKLEDIRTTGEISEAITPTSIIPSYTDNDRWRSSGTPSSDVHLYRMPSEVPQAIGEIVHTQGLVHEFGHTLVTQAIYLNGYRLRMPDGADVDAYPYLIGFAAQAEQHDPISHYSSFYRKPGEEFTSPLAIEEELVESIAARLLGFAYSSNPDRRLDPFADRPAIAYIVDSFLNAEVIPAEES
jgi:hypothetical protein